MVATVGETADPVIILTSKARGAELTSSYEKEKAALLLTLDRASASCPNERIPICSDSQSFLKAIQSGAHDTQSIRLRLDNRKGPTTHTWVPGNEAADELAKATATAKALIRRTITGPPCTNISPGRRTASPRPTGQMPFS